MTNWSNVPKFERYTVEDRGYETPCYIWQGAVNKRDGRPLSYHQNRSVYAHRLFFFKAYGVWPTEDSHHKCEVKLCVRPDHLADIPKAEHVRIHRLGKPRI